MKNWKLISGIISMCLFLVVAFQSCATNVVNALDSNDEDTSAGAGIILAFMLLIGGIVSIVTRKSTSNWGNILNAIVFGLGAWVGFAGQGTYGDLAFWSAWSLICCFFAIVCYFKNKVRREDEKAKPSVVQWIIAALIPIVICVLGNISSANGTSEDVDISTIKFIPRTAKQLLSEEEKNSSRAQQDYKGKYLEISGYVDDIDNDGEYFTIDDGGSFTFSSIRCDLKDENLKKRISKLNKGGMIKVKGQCKDVGGLHEYVIKVLDY